MAGIRKPNRRSRFYYRKWVLDEFIYKEGPRGLGKHRLPRLWPKSPWRAGRRKLPGRAKAFIALAAVVMLFACLMLCLTLASLLR